MENNDNRGALWTNTRKRPDKNDPQWTGSAMVDGVEYWVSAWPGKADNAKAPKVSFTFQKKESGKVESKPQISDDFNDDVPF